MSLQHSDAAATLAPGATLAAGPRFRITDSAIQRISRLRQAESGGAPFFRIAVTGGGCSGFQYNMSFDVQRNADDVAFERAGVTVLVDETSLGLLEGSELDFVDEMIGASFQVRNPNASSKCGCGNSFAV